MAMTRRVEVFQDPDPVAELAGMAPQPPSIVNRSSPVRHSVPFDYPLGDNVILAPPNTKPSGRSPLKSIGQATSSPTSQSISLDLDDPRTSLPPPPASIFTTDSPLKIPIIATSHAMVPPTSLEPSFTPFPTHATGDKENVRPTYHSDNLAEFPDPSCGHAPSLKRTFSNLSSQQERNPKKMRMEKVDLPDPEKMPSFTDDGRKPPFSYASLIGMSILRAPGRRLTLAQIYKWISDTFSYYRIQETGWQNSIRHNLSLNKAFTKQERPKDDPGKGNYWAIEPGMEAQFVKDKYTRRPASSSGLGNKSSSFLSSDAAIWSSQLPPAPAPKPVTKPTVPKPEAFEPSSDATIPASDAPSQDDEVDDIVEMPPPASRLPFSSSPQAIRSSPPVACRTLHHEDTPSPVNEVSLPTNRPKQKKRKIGAMDDSGYFSSLDSSASRSFANPKLPELNSDRPRMKRGRAEEEIARMRSSSHDSSPSRFRSFLTQPTGSQTSSSPLRHLDNSLMLPPLTPAVKLKPPPKPPASISPNTNLRIHRNKIRELVGSPDKHGSLYSEDVSFSPAFNIVDDGHNMFENDYPTFNIFTDDSENVRYRPVSTSPIKRSVQRPRTDRASRISNVLADVTGASINSKAMQPYLNTVNVNSPLQQKSNHPGSLKFNDLDDEAKEDFFDLDFFEDEEPDDFGGLDILQGFQKIGGVTISRL